MAKIFSEIDERLSRFIEAQHMFFVASAPSGSEGHVNLSPKGLDSFRILSPTRVAYLDFVGSGAETIAHLRENGRIVIMFCAFTGPPKILRLHGSGRFVEPGDGEWQELAARMPQQDGARAIVDVEVTRIADSCGYGVPRYAFEAERDQLGAWADRKGHAGLEDYKRSHNLLSIDELPALRLPSDD